jgi:amino acid adenylation domain-containing protein
MFILQNAPGGALELEGLTLSPLGVGDRDGTAKFDITVSMVDTPDGLFGAFEYSSDLYEAATIKRMISQFEKLLASVVETPDASVSALRLLGEGEESRMLRDWRGTRSAFASSSCLHHFFEHQAELYPDRIGLQFRAQSFSYRQLNEGANQLARLLISRGVHAETLVGICLKRTPRMILSMLAVLKAGGAYVPLDPAYPAQRLADMVADAGMAFVITDSTLQAHLATSPQSSDHSSLLAVPSIGLLCLDKEWDQVVAIQSTATPQCPATSANLAYVIYTSGSTGRAKGVAIAHRSAAALLHWAQLCYRPEQFAGVLASTSVCFDLSIFEIFVTLGSGGRVILVENALELMEMEEAAREEVRLINTVPSAMAELVRLGGVSAGVRVVNLAGEALSRSLVERVYEVGTVERVLNLYGPTEATTYSTYAEIAMGAEVSIGRAVENTEAYVLDGGMTMVPVGVVGELYLGGEGLARGYLHGAELTAEKFVPHPYSQDAGERLYRTGDVVRWLPAGDLEYIGRADQQVKVRGYRIELGEIETVLASHAGVREAVVMAREDQGGERRLVAYIVANEGEPVLTVPEMRNHLREKLPQYMIPSALVVLAEMPLTPNGKVDRRGLPVPDGMRPELERAYVAPRSATEEIVAAIWAELLGVERIGIHDNFFELGGHSLLATQVISKVREMFGVEVALRAIFEEPSVAGLAQRVEDAQREGVGLGAPPLVKVERSGKLPLSFAQQRLWFLDRLLNNGAVYNLSTALRLNGMLHLEALEQTLTEIMRRHEVLRTHYPIVDGEPVQVIAPAGKLELWQIDLNQSDESEVEAELLRVVSREAAIPFDLAAGPVLRGCLLRLGEDSHVLLLMMHHIAIDGWSMGVLVRELTLLYRAYSGGESSPLEELSVQYADYAVWQRDWLQGEVLERQISYWREQLGGVLPVLEIPTDRPRPALQTHRGARQSFMLPTVLADGLKALSKNHAATLYMVLLAAWQTLLSRYSGQDDVIVGTDIANRNRAETEALIGFFVNQLVMRTDLSGDPSFIELLGRVREVALGAYSHQDVPFEKLVEELQPVRDLSRTPMFQVKLVLQNVPTGAALELPGLTLSPIHFETNTAKFDLLMTMFEVGQELGGTLEYNTDLFDASTIARLLEHFGIVLEAIVAEPGQRISELPLVRENERRQMLDEWNQTRAEYPLDKRLHQLFEEQAERTPEAVAVVFEDARLSYAELNQRANQLAHHLKALGVEPETLVGICVERSLELVIGLLGILKAGGAYVPLDASYPLKRLSFMLENAQVAVLLTQESLIETLPSHWGHTICLDGDWDRIAVESTLNPEVEIDAQNPAYVLYTSGSTGSPKAVVISHAAICHHMHWMHSTFPLDEGDRVLQKTPISFDASVWEFYAPLMAGAQLVVARPGGHQDPAYLLEAINKHGVTILQVVPTLLRLLLEDAALAECHSLKRVFCGGEALTPELQGAFHAIMSAELINVYGPTEATIHASFTACPVCKEQPRPSIGRPIANAQLYILDHHQRLVPVGVAGELHVSGAGLARGYAHRADLTAEKFMPHPFSELPGERLYRTGDLARRLTDGQIEFLGRVDHQVKLRGFRVELGEIEVAIASHPAVRQAIVVAREDAPGEQRLVAYLVRHEESDLTVKGLRQYLKEKLPEYMIPAAFVVLDALPLTPNGKVERRSLPAPAAIAGDEDSFIAPRDAIELQLVEIWEEVLRVRSIGVTDDFFDLGGNSLLAVRLMAQIEIQFGQELSLSTLFQGATIEGLASALRNKTGGSPWSHLVALRPGTERPFFCVHAAGGNVFSYVELARQLGTLQPSYGLQAAGLDGKREPITTIEEMAAVYVKEMREVQPEGPYLLGGWSFGGVVAFEMAQQLQQQGREVALLALIDSRVPVASGYDYANDHAALVMMFARDLIGTLDDDMLTIYTQLQQRTQEEHLQYLLDQAISARVLPPETRVEQMLPLLQVYKANFLARENYRPQLYAGGITLFRASELVEEHDAKGSMGWSDLASGAVDVHLVPGSHYTMMRKPHVETLAEYLRSAIGQALVTSLVVTALE